MRAALLVVLLGCKAKKEPPPPPTPTPVVTKAELGQACLNDDGCTSRRCAGNVCTSGAIGVGCATDQHCDSGICRDQKCRADSIGIPCTMWDLDVCKGDRMGCFRGACRRLGALDDECTVSADCNALTCISGKCATMDAARTKQAAAEERRMLEESGLKPEVQAEKIETPPPPPGPGPRVRTVRVSGTDRSFAACKLDERLIGGGCEAELVSSSFPSGQSAEDTVGARWNCIALRQVTAYALCTKLR